MRPGFYYLYTRDSGPNIAIPIVKQAINKSLPLIIKAFIDKKAAKAKKCHRTHGPFSKQYKL